MFDMTVIENKIQAEILKLKEKLSIAEKQRRYRYLLELYRRLIQEIANVLNQYHKKNFSTRYWSILIGPWLRYYIYILYERFKTLEHIFMVNKNFQTLGLDEANYHYPIDTLDFMELLKEDSYNLQIYTKLIKSTKLFIITQYIKRRVRSRCNKKTPNNKLKRFFWIFIFYFLRKRKKLGLFKSYFPKLTRLYFMVFSMGKLMEIPEAILPELDCTEKDYSFSLRNEIKLKYTGNNQFEDFLYSSLIEDLPICFLEGYNKYFMHAKQTINYLGHIKGFVSANAWYYSELFKQISALKAESNNKLYGIQHGGNYGNIQFNVSCEHELEILDNYYTWGWSSTIKMVKPMPINKLSSRFSFNKNMGAKDVLYGLTCLPRFDNNYFILLPSEFEKYLNDQKVFISSLSEEAKNYLFVRPHHEDLGWNIKGKLRENFSQLKFDDWGTSFLERLHSCKLYICDHLSTTHIESLALNKPTILFWRPGYFPYSETAVSYYQTLKDVGILFDEPVSAAIAVNEIINDVECWWAMPERQIAVRKFCQQYARVSITSEKIWLHELLSLVNV